MPELSSFVGTLPGWITAGGVMGILAAILGFMPKWLKVKTEAKLTDSKIAAQLRNELFEKLTTCEKAHEELRTDYEDLRALYLSQKDRIAVLEESDRRKTIAMTLLMNEVQRFDPSNDVIVRAKGVLEASLAISPHDPKLEKIMHRLDNQE